MFDLTGKTALVRGIAAGLRAPRRAVTSPTFVLMQEYPARLTIYHFDAYRLRTPDEFSDLARATNEMAAGLSRQFDTLRTLGRIDGQILGGASIGHVVEQILEHLVRAHFLRTGVYDDVVGVVDDLLEVTERQVEQVAHGTGQRLEEPDVGHRHG